MGISGGQGQLWAVGSLVLSGFWSSLSGCQALQPVLLPAQPSCQPSPHSLRQGLPLHVARADRLGRLLVPRTLLPAPASGSSAHSSTSGASALPWLASGLALLSTGQRTDPGRLEDQSPPLESAQWLQVHSRSKDSISPGWSDSKTVPQKAWMGERVL